MADQSAAHLSEKHMLPPGRASALKSLVSISSNVVAMEMEAFVSRLSDALSTLADQSVRGAETEEARHAFQHLAGNKTAFSRLAASCITELLLRESAALNEEQAGVLRSQPMDLSLVTFEAMEHKVQIDNLSQAFDAGTSQTFAALNMRLARLLQREEIVTLQNPFRPDVFLQAVSDAWIKLDPSGRSHLLVVRQMRPEVFLPLEPLWQALNDALVAQNILPDLADPYRRGSAEARKAARREPEGRPSEAAETDPRKLPLYNKLHRWLSGRGETKGGPVHAPSTGEAPGDAIHPDLMQYLSDLQRQQPAQRAANGGLPGGISSSVLHRIREHAPPGSLSQTDANALELLAKTFDHLFREQYIPLIVKELVAQLQIPLLKAALADKEFFFREDHPARRLLDKVTEAGVACDEEKGHADPLYKMIERIVERVQQEYDRQLELFDDAVDDLDAFMEQEAGASADALARAIAEANRQEKISRAKAQADEDVSRRIDTGEVAGFVEVFLETQWTRVLGMAHTVEDSKPEVLQNAIKTMDDLIWSVKPKTSPEDRKALLARLPSLLSMLNAWLNAVNWEGPERVAFFATLASRHAALVRTHVEPSPRQQLEMAMNAVQKASERRLNQREMEFPEKIIDKYTYVVDALEPGVWAEFQRANGTRVKFRLAWISPLGKLFVFANRQGKEPFTFTFDELAQALRTKDAEIVTSEAPVIRALAAALEEVGG